MLDKTIYALSTVYGKSGVAIIRISGSNALSVIDNMTSIKSIKPRYAYFSDILNGSEVLDKALVLYFKGPYSFTGEDVVELHCHGSKAVIASILEVLSQLPYFRLAEAGEFSKRAFYNNKMDLTQAEGLADLIDSETKSQQRSAISQLEGGLSKLYNGWAGVLLELLAHLEAFIDFPDEDIPQNIIDDMENTVFKLMSEIRQHLETSDIGERLRDGYKVAIIGPTNAGKSSLLNAITNRNTVIVSDVAGTTRDAIDIHLDLKGYPVIFTDTAGLRETSDEIEQQGISIALQKQAEADFVLYLFDASKDSVQLFENQTKKGLYVANKVDKLNQSEQLALKEQGCVLISAKHNLGIDDLLIKIGSQIEHNFASFDGALMTRGRYKQSLNEVLTNLNSFSFDKEIELSAEDIRLATRALGQITGKVEINDILNKIFSDFCIGK